MRESGCGVTGISENSVLAEDGTISGMFTKTGRNYIKVSLLSGLGIYKCETK